MDDLILQKALNRYIFVFENLTPEMVNNELKDLFDPSVEFIDPFNHAKGLDETLLVFEHMFESLHAARFEVTEQMRDKNQAFLVWTFTYQRNPNSDPQKIKGVSKVSLTEEGLIVHHEDFWDASTNVYLQVPILGWLIRLIRNKLSALS